MDSEYLAALALIKTSYDQNGTSFLEYVTPFVADTIRADASESITPGDLRDRLLIRYGLEIPEGVLATVVKRLAREGFGNNARGSFHPDLDALETKYNFDEMRRTNDAAIKQLTASFNAFVSENFDKSLTEAEASAALTQYANKNGLPILRTAHTNEPLPASLSLDETEYVTSRFVVDAFENARQEMKTLTMLAKGSMLASVLYLPDPSDVERRIDGLTVYFDTPTLLSALGYQGPEQERSAREVLDLAYRSGLDLAVFDHTVEEVGSVLTAVGNRVGARGYAGAAPRGVEAHFLAQGLNASDIKLLVARLPKNLKTLRINVVDRPPPRDDWTIDEGAFEEILWEEVKYQRREPLLHDLDAVTATFRKRKGRRPPKFEDCGSVFVTPNSPLARETRRFFDREFGPHWPVAITEDDFATLMWLKHPLAAPDLPEQRIVADAYAALEPRAAPWTTFLDELDRLLADSELTIEDYILLRYDSGAKTALMDQSLGVDIGMDAATVKTVLAAVRASASAPSEALAAKTIDRLSKAEDRIADLDRRLERERHEIERLRRHEANVREAARRRGVRDGLIASRALVVVAVLTIAAGIYFALPADWSLPPDPRPGWAAAAARLSLLVVAVCTFFNLTIGWHVIGSIKRVEVWIASRRESRYLAKAGVESGTGG